MKDSFGRSALQATLDAMAQLHDSEPTWKKLKTNVEQICVAMGIEDVEGTLKTGVTDRTQDEAKEEHQARLRILRARCLEEQNRKKAETRARGLEAIAQSYQPLHPDVFLGEFTEGQLHADMRDKGTSPGELESLEEPYPGVFCFPLVTPEYCAQLWEEMHHFESQAVNHPELGLPLYVRHDGNFGNLQDCGFEPVLRALQKSVLPFVQKHMPDVGLFEIYHAFMTRNYVGRESNATFKMHCDKSDLTFNVCLHASPDFEGSTVGFYCPGEDNSVPTDPEHRQYTHVHSVGKCVFHNGGQWHKTDPITKGTRGSLIVWARLCNSLTRPKVGDLVKLGANPRVTTGPLEDDKVGVLVSDDGVSRQPFLVSDKEGNNETYYHMLDLVVVDDKPEDDEGRRFS